MLQGAEIVNQPGGPKSISAKYQRPRERKERPGANVLLKRMQAASEEQKLTAAVAYAKEAVSVTQRWLLYGHLSAFEAEAAKRYAYVMGRFDRYFTEGRRSAKSQNYERAYGEDQELERRKHDGSLEHYEKAAKQARKRYDKLQKILVHYRDITGRNLMKDALDQMCCEDIEPPAQYRSDIAAALRHIGHEFGVTVQSRRGRPRKGRG
jgi:hypothetical protein